VNTSLFAVRKLDDTFAQGKESIIVAATHEVTRMKASTTLTHQDFTGTYVLPSKTLNAQTL